MWQTNNKVTGPLMLAIILGVSGWESYKAYATGDFDMARVLGAVGLLVAALFVFAAFIAGPLEIPLAEMTVPTRSRSNCRAKRSKPGFKRRHYQLGGVVART
jgi:hypothetical protein